MENFLNFLYLIHVKLGSILKLIGTFSVVLLLFNLTHSCVSVLFFVFFFFDRLCVIKSMEFKIERLQYFTVQFSPCLTPINNLLN